MNYDSPAEIARLLAERGLTMKKRFGQNFLVSPGARQKLSGLVLDRSRRKIWEIGGGIGSMTQELAGSVEHLTVFEIDRGFARCLEEQFSVRSNVRIVTGDFLENWEAIATEEGAPDLIFGNLPYVSAATMIGTLIERASWPTHFIATVQREVADRIAARPGTKAYSGFSILCQASHDVSRRGELAAASFFPVPEVVSSIVELVDASRDCGDHVVFPRLVRDLFSARRKTLRNTITSGWCAGRYGSEQLLRVLQQCGIDGGRRGETLTPSEAARLGREVSRLNPLSDGEPAGPHAGRPA